MSSTSSTQLRSRLAESPRAQLEINRWEVFELLLVASPAEFDGEGRVMDAVVAVLGCRWPLSLKAIFFAVSREYALRVSYQAVHKALGELVQKGVVVKEDRAYCLSIDWIRKVKRFGASLERAYMHECFDEKIQQLV